MERRAAGYDRQAERLALGLGWFSIALGVAELAMPRSIARFIGAPDDERSASVLRTMGAREIGHGVSILAQPEREAWMWTRVGGDAVDLGFLGSAFNMEEADPRRLAAATAAVAGVAALGVMTARRLGRISPEARAAARTVRVEQVVTINRSIDEVYREWRDLERFPRFMRHLESVQVIDAKRSRWRAKGPAGMRFEWEAEIVEERESEYLAWRSLEGGDVEHRGDVRFSRAPGARGTEVRVRLEYQPPAGAVGRTLAWLFGEEPEQQIADDLRRFKQLLETGEIPLSEGPGMWRPAQPAADPREIRAISGGGGVR